MTGQPATAPTRIPGRYRQLEVVEVVAETAHACTLVLRVPDELAAEFSYRPGQYLTVQVPPPGAGAGNRNGGGAGHGTADGVGDGAGIGVGAGTGLGAGPARCYSLSSCPQVDRLPRITVKRVPGGYVSNWICDHVRAGAALPVLPPAGRFTPSSLDDDVLLLAAGSGITPVMSILRAVLAGGRGDAVLLYANRNREDVIFARELAQLQARHPGRLRVDHWLDDRHGLPNVAGLQEVLAGRLPARAAAAREAFVCGPGPFMDVAVDAVTRLGVPVERLRVERFELLADVTEPATALPATAPPTAVPATGARPDGTAPADPDQAAGTTTGAGAATSTDEEPEAGEARPAPVALSVTRNGRVHTLPWPAGARLLDVLIRAGLNPPFSCRQGQCGACACRITQGEVELVHNEVLEEEDFAENYILACQALARSERVDISYD